MEKRKYSISEIKKKITEYKKRLYNLKLQGFTFSQEIYDNIDVLEKKISQGSLFHRTRKKKLLILTGSIIVILTVIAIYLWISQITPPPSIEIKNLSDGEIINDDFLINGTIFNSNGKISISAIQVNIDRTEEETWENANLWENANGIYNWNYTLKKDNLTNLTNGNSIHFIYFRCHYYGKYTTPIHRWFEYNVTFLSNETILRPTVTIENPKDGKKIWGIVPINGSAKSEGGVIQKVEFKIDDETYKLVSGTTKWDTTWNTSEYENNVLHKISVRCIDENGTSSKEESINVYVENFPPDEGIIVGDEKFQIHFSPLSNVLPNYTYTVNGIHQKKYKIANYNQWTTFETEEDYNWLEIDTPEGYLVTPSDGQKHPCSFTLKLTSEAKQNTLYVVMMVYQTGQLYNDLNPDNNPIWWNVISQEYRDEYYFRTGQW